MRRRAPVVVKMVNASWAYPTKHAARADKRASIARPTAKHASMGIARFEIRFSSLVGFCPPNTVPVT
jgi:hypothetical protein